MEDKKLVRAIPPKEFFSESKKTVLTHAIGPAQLLTPTYRVELPEGGGIWSWMEGDKYPYEGWSFREATFAVDSVKRAIISVIKFIVKLPSNIWHRRVIYSSIEIFVEYADMIFDRWGRVLEFEDDKGQSIGLEGVYFKPELFCEMVREIWRVGMEMADDQVNIDGVPVLAHFVRAICMICEFDDAWRYRIQDFFGIINKEAFLKNPRKELKRAFEIFISRGPNEAHKIKYFATFVPYLLWVPTIRKTVTTFVSNADFTKLSLSSFAFYRILLWGGYQFSGIPDVERVSLRMMIDAEWQHGINEKNKHK